MDPVLACSSSSLREPKSVVLIQSRIFLRGLLKSPIMMTPRPANLSEIDHFSAVCMTYSSGLSGDWTFRRYSKILVHIVYGPLDFGGTITWMMDKAALLYVIRILVTKARPEGSDRCEPTHCSHCRSMIYTCPPIVMFRPECVLGRAVLKVMTAVPWGRAWWNCRFILSTLSSGVRASVIPSILICAASSR